MCVREMIHNGITPLIYTYNIHTKVEINMEDCEINSEGFRRGLVLCRKFI